MEDAMNLVRQELGHDAVVVDSKEVQTRRLLPWPSTRQEIQVSAEPNQVRAERPRKVKPTAKPERTIRTLAEANQIIPPTSRLLGAVPELDSRLAAALTDDVDSVSPSSSAPKVSITAATVSRFDQPVEPIDAATNQSMLESLQRMMRRLEQQMGSTVSGSVPDELSTTFYQLLDKDVDDRIARDLIAKLGQHLNADSLRSPTTVTATLMALIEREMRCAPPIQPKQGCREIVMLVGPTGVGKTTTVAKLAGRFHLQEGLRVGLITIDTYRVGAIEQLHTFAEILQVPMLIASNAEELRQAIDQLDNVDVILIDTAGRSPFDDQKMEQLRELVAVANPDHVMLAISLASGGRVFAKIAEQFSTVSPTSLVVTKVDECYRCGNLLSVVRDVPYPIRYLTTGQDVPDHIEPSHPSRLARLVLDT